MLALTLAISSTLDMHKLLSEKNNSILQSKWVNVSKADFYFSQYILNISHTVQDLDYMILKGISKTYSQIPNM